VETLRHSLFNNNTPAFAAAHSSPAHLFNEEELQEELPKLLKQCNVEDWSFSMNVGNSYSCLQESDKTSPCEHELQQPTVKKPDEGECCPDTIVRKPPLGRRETPDAGHSFANCSFSPSLMSFQHSTPDEQTTLATVSRVEPTNLESLFMSDNGHNELKCEEVNNDCTDEKIDAKFTVSWHDWSAGDRRRSRSCVSLDESMFLSNDLALIDSPCATDICTAVTSLEQLEREIAGVLSDCGEMERCVGVLRQHDQRDQVAKRYSLGVADSVIAADVRLLGGWRDMSAVSEVPNSSASVIHGRDSGYIWDDELMGNDSVPLRTSTSSASITRRITRSLSPQPTTRAERRYANARSSFGACVVDAHACGLVSADQKVEKETNTPPPVDSAQCLRGLLVSEGAID
jgi:hypothetical protein